jgi:Ca2+-binding RTX toxin-like protein
MSKGRRRVSVTRATVMGAGLGVLLLVAPAVPAAAQATTDLQVAVAHAPEPAAVGSDLSFGVGVSNAGPDDATGVQLVLRFPDADAVLASAQAGQGLCSETAPGEVTCDVGTLAPGAAVSVDVVITPVGGSAIPAAAEADSVEDAPAPSSDSATVTGRPCDVVGTQGDDTLTASSPSDVVCGLGGNDVLTGVEGDETLNGGSGDDLLSGETGNDVLDGGQGVDTASYATALEGVRADPDAGTATVEAETDVLTGVENLIGSPFEDHLTGSTGPNRIAGGGGLDLLFGGDGSDVLLGEGGDDYLNGGPGADDLHGGPGVDTCAVEEGTTASCQLDSPLDPDDATGRLDVRRIETSFGPTSSSWTFVTHGRWSRKQIWDEGFAVVSLDTSGDGSAEYRIVVRVRSDGRAMTAFLRRLSDSKQWGLDTWRPGWRSVGVRLPMSRVSFAAGRTYYRWWGQTLFSHSRCKKAVCFDLTPGSSPRGRLIQPVP